MMRRYLPISLRPMSQHQKNASIGSELSDRTLTMNLIWRGENELLIRSCDILGRGFRSRFSFTDNRLVEEVLMPGLAQSITGNLQSVPDGAQVISLPDFLLELSGIVLSGLHIMVSEACGDARSIILRFKHFFGSVSKAFRVDLGIETALVPHGHKLAMNVLEDICLPILNLCHTLDDLARAQGQVVNPKLLSLTQEFYFQTELLKRFITNSPEASLISVSDRKQRPAITDRGWTQF